MKIKLKYVGIMLLVLPWLFPLIAVPIMFYIAYFMAIVHNLYGVPL